MFRFANETYLYFLIAVPVFILLYWFGRYLNRRALQKFGDHDLVESLMPLVSKTKPAWKFWLTMTGYVFLVFTLARPQFGSKLEEVKREGVEVIIALDVSNSMMAEDILPNRLERAKQSIERLVDKLEEDKIGLIVFAGDAYTQVPITTDYVSVKMFLASINTNAIPKQGTAIGSAIELATNSFSPVSDANRAIIIITDGENHEDDPVAAARVASEKGIIIHTLGIGLPQGAPIPISDGSANQAFRKDREGNTVISKLDEGMLQQIAFAGQGKYIRATNSRLGLNSLFDEINRMEEKELETRIYSAYDERFQYLAAFALLFLMLEFIIVERRNRKISLFQKTIE